MSDPCPYVLYQGDCLDVLRTLPAASVDSVVCDPPYPEIDREYGRWTEAEWHALMHGVVAEVRRVLKPSGSAVFVLQPNSERVGRMRPWLWDFMAWACREWNIVQDAWWWNHNAMPGRRGGLLRPSLKACVWLGPPECYRNQAAVLWSPSQAAIAEDTAARAGRRPAIRHNSPSGNGINKTTRFEALGRTGGVTPFNVLPIANANSVSSGGVFGHGAATPAPLCDWWIRYLTPPGGVVLDPFMGSGTTGLVALRGGWRYLGIERAPHHFATAQRRIEGVELGGQLPLLLPAEGAW